MKFIDQVRIHLQSGQGGAGCVSFRKEPFYPRGGPNGGQGGRGGHVVFEATTSASSLFPYKGKKQMSAGKGAAGQSSHKTGMDGKDLRLLVPIGTTVKDENGTLLLDMSEAGEYVFLKGGRGGKGNSHFKNSVNQAPTYAQPGEIGEESSVLIELKVIADVGVIGFPNAGKSTLISCVTAAKPQIADYPFTTINPQLGSVELGDQQNFIIADIPGLIKGAHTGQGLGHKFLKHIERTKCFVHMLDLSDFSGREPWQDYKDINEELEKYDELNKKYDWYTPLSTRRQLVVFNKLDACSEDRLHEVRSRFNKENIKTIEISAVTRKGLDTLVQSISKMLFNRESERGLE